LKTELVATERASKERIKAAQDKLDVSTARLNEMKERVEKVADANSGEIVHLNVGGTVFSASKDVFMSSTDSFFYNMLGSEDWAKNDSGHYFVDRDPSLFHHVMTYLRTGGWHTNCLNAEELDRLETELEFYDLKLPRNWGTFDSFKSYSGISLDNGGHTCTGPGTTLGLDYLPSHAVWDITIDAKTGNSWTGIGIATSNTDLGSLCCDTSFGCGLYIDQVNCHFRQKGNNVEELNAIIGPATPGKVIRVTFNRTKSSMTIRYEVDGRATPDYAVMLPDRKVYVAMSPTSDCVMSLIVVSESNEEQAEAEAEAEAEAS